MGKKKFYAVKAGRVPGIYQTWSEANEQTKGYNNADFKSFISEKEAIEWMSLEEIDEISYTNEQIEKEITNLKNDEVIAFVDGSYSSQKNGKEKYSFGAILINNDSENNLFKSFVASKYMNSKNIAGETEGVKQAISWAIQAKKRKIKIFHDYEGIEKWANKKWSPKTLVARDYVNFIEINSKAIDIEFAHVKSHSGIIYNEKADQLARRALLDQGYKTYDDGSILFTSFQKQDWLDIIQKLKEKNELNILIEEGIVDENKKSYLNRLIFRLDKDKVTINCYSNNKSYVQGKQSMLFQIIITAAIEMLPSEKEAIGVLQSYYMLPIKEENLQTKFSNFLPNFSINSNDFKIKNILLSAVCGTLMKGYLPDYTYLVMPLFRSMEYYLHIILGDKLGRKTTRKNGANDFCHFSFNKKTNEYEYNHSTKERLNNEQLQYLNKLYNMYNKLRHPYFHLPQNLIDASVISKLEEAQNILVEGLKLINKFYLIF
ncbi:Predicted double-stranded RNA/RNA-DNA hybrid binding protein [Metamycoplasma arthritidis]|uniref:Ribonuclease H n=1 Tax=Metamycoplasma arthritidis (strain 158L3-1) TaxID=243272 RepID=B3PN28_META1|nr:type II toxin-antitoxin system RnlA family toxin [Metamycoplasma arthritidis]ACF07430.1 ribonuclease HI [Metamycoplasma arthritidis 158L3-1]VEU78952.1 Predicted double-stranded RNA/RNA-DNA hybrid binding protein [Metamycoplasma arthritidis]